jgi:phosphatidate cytidylyltransferase
MKTRILVAVVCVPIYFFVIFFLPGYVFAAVTALICALSAFEVLLAAGLKQNPRIVVYAVASAALFPVAAHFTPGSVAPLAICLLLTCLIFVEAALAYETGKHITLAGVLSALFGGMAIPYLLSTLVYLKDMPDGRVFALLPIICAFVTDAGAYFTGVAVGRRKVFPRISPKKTLEGCIGGLVAGVVAVVLYGVLLFFETQHEIELLVLALYGFVGALMTELGDVVFSLVKRECDVKDFGRLLPGHGGMLDRFDSMVFAAPAMYLLVTVLPGIYVL